MRDFQNSTAAKSKKNEEAPIRRHLDGSTQNYKREDRRAPVVVRASPTPPPRTRWLMSSFDHQNPSQVVVHLPDALLPRTSQGLTEGRGILGPKSGCVTARDTKKSCLGSRLG